MPLDGVIEQRCPDFVVPQHRATVMEAGMGIKPESRNAQNATMEAHELLTARKHVYTTQPLYHNLICDYKGAKWPRPIPTGNQKRPR